MEINKKWIVYKHTNLVNGKVYIGITNQKPEYRWGKNGSNYKGKHFTLSIQKYGWENFSHEILYKDLSLDKANKIEQYLIYLYNTQNPQYGYNKDAGGNNKIPSIETRERQRISALNRANIITSETKEKLSKVSLGAKRSEETKKKMSEAARKREQEKNGKKTLKVKCVNTGEVFKSLRAAADWCGLAGVSGISSVCKHGKQSTAGIHPITKEKLKWEYVKDE